MVRLVKVANTTPPSLGESADSIDTPSDDSDPDESSIAEPSYATRPAEGQSAATSYRYLKPARSNDASAGLSLDNSSIMASIETSADLDTSSGLIRFDEASSGADSGRQAVGSHLKTSQPRGQDSQAPLLGNEPDFCLPDATSGFGQALPTALDLTRASLPKPSNPPTNQDWKTYRETITRLYATEARSLKETRDILKARHSFQASERMFKQRIAEWKLRKNAHSRHSDSLSDEAPPSSTSGNQVVRTTRLRRTQGGKSVHGTMATQQTHLAGTQTKSRKGGVRVARKPLTSYLESYLLAQKQNVGVARFKAISQDLSNVETLLSQIDSYFDSFFHAAWKRTYPNPPRMVMREMPLCLDMAKAMNNTEAPVAIHPTSLFSRLHAAVVIFKKQTPETTQVGFKFIGEAFDILKPTLAQQHPRLLSSYLEQFYSPVYDAYPGVMQQLFHFSAELASVIFGERHPIVIFCRLLPRIENRLEILELCWRRLLDSFHAKIGVSHEEVLRAKLAFIGVLIERGKYDEAEQLLEFFLANHERPPTDYWVRAARCRLAWLYIGQQRHAEAEEVVHDLWRRYREVSGGEELQFDAIHIASHSLLARSYRDRGQHDRAESILKGALDSCLATVGPEHGFSMSIMFELEDLEKLKSKDDRPV